MPIVLETQAPAIAMAFTEDGQELVAIGADNTPRSWVIDVNELNKRLTEAHADCLPPLVRSVYLGEDAAKAEARYAECERSYRREPALLEAK